MKMDEQKKRLMELLENSEGAVYWNGSDKDFIEKIADYLLANGVLVPPCKVGDKLWWACNSLANKLFDSDPGIGVYEEKCGVPAIVWDGAEFGVMIDGDVIPFGDQYAMLSEADAKKWLEEHRNG